MLVLFRNNTAFGVFICARTATPVPLLVSLQSLIFAIRSLISLFAILIDAWFEISSSPLFPFSSMMVLFLNLFLQGFLHVGLQSKVGIVEFFFLDFVCSYRVFLHLLYGPLESFFSACFLLGGCVSHHVLLNQFVSLCSFLIFYSLVKLFRLLIRTLVACILNSKDFLFLKSLHIIFILHLHLFIFSFLTLFIILVLSLPLSHQLIIFSCYFLLP